MAYSQPLQPSFWPEGFRTFWNAYPRKEAEPAARAAWNRLQPTEEQFAAIMWSIAWQRETFQWRHGYVPMPAHYLEDKRWLDEPFRFRRPVLVSDLARAREVRARIGRCPHQPKCADSESCAVAIVRSWQAKAE